MYSFGCHHHSWFLCAGTLQRGTSSDSLASPLSVSSIMQERENELMATRSETSGIIREPKTTPDRNQWASEEYAVRSESCDLLSTPLRIARTNGISHPSNVSIASSSNMCHSRQMNSQLHLCKLGKLWRSLPEINHSRKRCLVACIDDTPQTMTSSSTVT